MYLCWAITIRNVHMRKKPNMQIFFVKRFATHCEVSNRRCFFLKTYLVTQHFLHQLGQGLKLGLQLFNPQVAGLAKKRETFKTHLEKGIIEISCNIPRFVIIGNAWHLFTMMHFVFRFCHFWAPDFFFSSSSSMSRPSFRVCHNHLKQP